MAIALGLGHAQALTPCGSSGSGVLRDAVWWIDACRSAVLPEPPPLALLQGSTWWIDAADSGTL